MNKHADQSQPVMIQQIRELLDGRSKEDRKYLDQKLGEQDEKFELRLYEERKYTKQMVQEVVEKAVQVSTQHLATKADVARIRTMLEGDHRAVVEDTAKNAKQIVHVERRVIILEHDVANLKS